jgi:hypothetical protein
MQKKLFPTIVGVLLILLSSMVTTSAHAAWQAWNTCWTDMAAGGGRMCTIQHSGCGGEENSGRVWCHYAPFDQRPAIINPNTNAAVWNIVKAKSVAVDETGRVIYIGTDNRIYYESPYKDAWLQKASIAGNPCIDRIEIIGQLPIPAPGGAGYKLLVKTCDGSAYSDVGGWHLVGTSVTEISTLNYVDGRRFTMRSSAANSPIYWSNLAGGTFSSYWPDTRITECSPLGGCVVRNTSMLAGRFMAITGSASCLNSQPPYRSGRFYAMQLAWLQPYIMGGDTTGCTYLWPPLDTDYETVDKMRYGLGPGNRYLWVHTAFQRVFSLD